MATTVTRPDKRGGVRGFAGNHPLWAYFVAAYAFSWTYWLLLHGVLDRDSELLAAPGVYGPAAAAFLVAWAVEGRAGVRRLLRRIVLWRVPARWYLVALVALPAMTFASFVFLRGGTDALVSAAAMALPTYLVYLLVIVFVGGGQEEPGWRGFALPRLQQHLGPLAGSLALGLLWGLWHLPLYLLIEGYNFSEPGAAGVAGAFGVFVCYTVGLSLILTWLFNHTRGSVLIAILAHASVNAPLVAFAPETATAAISLYVTGAVVGVLVAAGTRGHLGYASSTAPGRAL